MATQCPGRPGLGIAPNQHWDSPHVDLGIRPVTAPPFTSRAFAFFSVLELIQPSPNQGTVPSFSFTGTSGATLQGWSGGPSLGSIVELQVLHSQSPGSAWACPTSEVPDRTRGSLWFLEVRS
jgi:hypothetical protein